MQTEVKICGITNLTDAIFAVKSGAKYLGLNFFPDSPRFLNLETVAAEAIEIKNTLPAYKLVGVFVNETIENVKRLAEICELDILQFHGDESPEYCEKFALPVWKAFRVKDASSLEDLEQFLHLDGIVLDAWNRSAFGGTGQTFSWKLIQKIRNQIPFLILSGGLKPENVAEAIKTLQPDVIDICSGVEAAGNPRKKDQAKIRELFDAIQL
ncbi:MAG: phosphoribosylanthranilate isomerase [Candidatus Gracilibacteria bacterium]|jgi:phosphoribosylanthranilate isomerase|nr:phosphoribosylanthranilate isomerase [Candidatus Gracilibacteria bacterium]MDD5179128.1 phosphoribosylanthranilate isomerase [Candidatus Gracilibacteria bacterium]